MRPFLLSTLLLSFFVLAPSVTAQSSNPFAPKKSQPKQGSQYKDAPAAQHAQKHRAQVQTQAEKARKIQIIFLSGIVFFAFLGGGFFLLKRLGFFGGKKDEGNQRGGGQAEAMAFAKALQGKSSPDLLMKCVFNAVRFGNFTEYSALFPTQVETKQLLSAEKNEAYWQGPRSDQNLRTCFEALRRAARDGQVQLKEGVQGPMSKVRTPSGSIVMMASDNKLALMSQDGEALQITIGSMVKLPVGWKLFMPNKPSA